MGCKCENTPKESVSNYRLCQLSRNYRKYGRYKGHLQPSLTFASLFFFFCNLGNRLMFVSVCLSVYLSFSPPTHILQRNISVGLRVPFSSCKTVGTFFSIVLLSVVSITCSQLWSKNISEIFQKLIIDKLLNCWFK